ncbi:MAG: biotin transporter BioY [Rhodobacteraceae bacterium]|nr:biotin transporter BioY [Paracoccaceae bacterium]
MTNYMTLSDAFWRSGSLMRQVVLVVAGIALMAIAAKIKVPLPNTPVPVSMGTFAVLTIGAAYGPRLGLATIIGYLIIGALGFDVFANSSAALNGWTYMTGSTGGYLVGFVLALLVLAYAATKGWDRSMIKLVPVLVVANAFIYIPGMAWLSYLYGMDISTAFAKGVAPFLMGDVLKIALAALLLPAAWAIVKRIKG